MAVEREERLRKGWMVGERTENVGALTTTVAAQGMPVPRRGHRRQRIAHLRRPVLHRQRLHPCHRVSPSASFGQHERRDRAEIGCSTTCLWTLCDYPCALRPYRLYKRTTIGKIPPRPERNSCGQRRS